MIGAKADGAYGPKTAQAFTDFQDAKKVERGEWIQKLQDAAQSPTVIAARTEITRLRSGAEQQIANSNTLINRLRTQLGNTTTADTVQGDIDAQQARIKAANNEIDTLTEEKITLEAEYRKLEAEVGPIKYIAEFVYGEAANKSMLEEAVKWVIIVIIFVFDPLAVLLLLAAQYTFQFRREDLYDDDGERLRLEQQEFERARAQRIVDNVPPNYDPIEVPEETEEIEVPVYVDIDQETIDKEFAETTTLIADDTGRVEATEQDYNDDQLELDFSKPEEPKKKVELLEDSKKLTKEELDELDNDVDWKHAKHQWKAANPNENIKMYKDWYLSGKIDTLPWEEYLPTNIKKKRAYLMKQDGKLKKGQAED
jgi:hypothetical protein